MKKILFTIITSILLANTVVAQEDSISLQKDSNSFFNEKNEDIFMEKAESNFLSKMRRGWYTEPYFGFAFTAGGMENTAAQISYGESYTIDFGIKWRYQVSQLYSLTIGTYFLHNRYRIVDGMENNILNISDSILQNHTIQTERFRTWGFGISIGNRFNFDTKRRYERLGKYIEVGAYGCYNYSRNYGVNYIGGSEIEAELIYKDPILFHPFEAGLQASLAWQWFSISARYRLTDTFDKKYSSAELPKLSIGAIITFGSTKL